MTHSLPLWISGFLIHLSGKAACKAVTADAKDVIFCYRTMMEAGTGNTRSKKNMIQLLEWMAGWKWFRGDYIKNSSKKMSCCHDISKYISLNEAASADVDKEDIFFHRHKQLADK